MFNTSKYTRIYYQIINRAQTRKLDGYCEEHHIVPKCLGGSNSKENLVELTAREHFICHLLLTKMSSMRNLKYGLYMMTVRNKHHEERYIPSSRVYEIVKKANSDATRERMTGGTGTTIGKLRYYNAETLEERFSKTPIEGWCLGSLKQRRRGKNAGKIYYNDPITKNVIALNSGEIPPTGYVRGNPNAASNLGVVGKKVSHCPTTGKISKSFIIPGGYVEGDPHIWINNGLKCRKMNAVCEELPYGWTKGKLGWEKTAVSRKNNGKKKVMTPWGMYLHPLRFAEEFRCAAPYIFSNVDTKIQRIYKKYEYLNSKLKEIGYDFSKTKRENGFYFMKDDT